MNIVRSPSHGMAAYNISFDFYIIGYVDTVSTPKPNDMGKNINETRRRLYDALYL